MFTLETECIDYIHSLGKTGCKAGLLNIKALLNLLGNPQRDLRCIHVAGTNGKGSVCSYLMSILRESGLKIGMNTSPYIEVFNERLTINGENIPKEKLIYYTNMVAEAIEKGDLHPIEFEVITAIGFLYFKDEKCDYAIIECGIGGLLDSTNVIENPSLCVIGQLGLDHTEILGDTIEKIAYQKAGIIKPNSVVALHPDICTEALDVIGDVASKMGAKVCLTPNDYYIIKENEDTTEFYSGGLRLCTRLLGTYQPSNASLAVNCAKILKIDDNFIKKGIERARWKCRFEKVRQNVIIDGAHNFQGIQAFCESVRHYNFGENNIFVVGMLNDKDFDLCVSHLATLDGKFVLTSVPNSRQTDFSSLCSKMKIMVQNLTIEEDYKKATDFAIKKAGSDGMVYVAGSLYLAGAVRKYLS